MKLIVTGSSGFIASHFFKTFGKAHACIPVRVRHDEPISLPQADAIIHFAGLAHQKKQLERQAYIDANYLLTKQLYTQAVNSGVRQFVYLSSIKVYGPYKGELFNLESERKPENDPYGESKKLAEDFLIGQQHTHTKVAIIRPPLVYGPGVKANMYKLIKLCDSKMPLPFEGMQNERTIVSVTNLNHLINHILKHDLEGVFLAGDAANVSTAELVTMIRKVLDRPFRLMAMPSMIRQIIQKLMPGLADRVFGSLAMDVHPSYKKANFVPPVSTEKEMENMVNWYKTMKI